MSGARANLWAMMLAIVVQVWLAQAGCTKDTDCKGDRICEAGVCVSPKPPETAPAATPPPPPPMPPTTPDEGWPRVVRRDGLVCVQAPGADGRIEESCRREDAPPSARRAAPLNAGASSIREEPEPPPTRWRGSRGSVAGDAAPEEPRARFVADAFVQGGVSALIANTGTLALPQINGQLSLGARFRAGVGVVGTGALLGTFGPGGSLIVGTLGPGVRFGDRSHFTLSAGGSVLGYSTALGSGSGLMFSVLAQGVFALASAFGLSLQAALHADASGAMVVLGAGLGFGAF